METINNTSISQTKLPSIAIIGTGIAGLSCARYLTAHGYPVTIFEQNDIAGGRIATRHHQALIFDHGAPYFTVRSDQFGQLIEQCIADNIVAKWTGKISVWEHDQLSATREIVDRYVGIPTMDALPQYLARDLNIIFNTKITRLELLAHNQQISWQLIDQAEQQFAMFDLVIAALPAEQSTQLLRNLSPIAISAANVHMNSCWAVMAAFNEALAVDFDAAFINGAPLCWIVRNNSKPQRNGVECWVLHAAQHWSQAHLNDSAYLVIAQLLDNFYHITNTGTVVKPIFTDAYLWPEAIPVQSLKESYLFDASLGLGACGDWCGGPRVEGAFLSGLALAEKIVTKSY